MDRLIEKAEAAREQGEQAKYYREIQERLLAQLPYIPLWYEDTTLVARDEILGYTLSSDGNYDGLLTVQRDATGKP